METNYYREKSAVNEMRLKVEVAQYLVEHGDYSVIDVSMTAGEVRVVVDPALEEAIELAVYEIIDNHVPVELSEAKASRLLEIKLARRAYLDSYFDIDTRDALRTIGASAMQTGKASRLAYVTQVATWAVAVMTYCVGRENAVSAAATVADVNAVTLDIAANTSVPPAVTISGALAIPN